jgi:hypothetical protein
VGAADRALPEGSPDCVLVVFSGSIVAGTSKGMVRRESYLLLKVLLKHKQFVPRNCQ